MRKIVRCFIMRKTENRNSCVRRVKAAFAAVLLCVAVAAQPIAASAWTLDDDQQMFVDSMIAGRESLMMGDYDSAINSLNRALQYRSNSASAYFYRAQAKQYRGNASEAVSDYSAVMRLTDKNSTYYAQAKSMALQLGVSDTGTTIGSGLLQAALSSVAQVEEATGETRGMTKEERELYQQSLDSYTQKGVGSVYYERFGDHSDIESVREVYNKRNAVLAGIEETYSTNEKETIYCGSGRTGICLIGSDSIQIEEKQPTVDDLIEDIVDELNPFSGLVSVLKGGEEEVVDYAPKYEKIAFSLSNPYTAVETETVEKRNQKSSTVKIHLPIGTQVKMLSLNSEGINVGAEYEDFIVEPGAKTKAYTLSGSIVFVGE